MSAANSQIRVPRKLLEDMLILLAAFVLTDPHTTQAWRKLIPGLIKRIHKELK